MGSAGWESATGPGVDEGLIGKTLFAFHPHQDTAVVPLADCHRIPDGVPPEAALFLPQVETALNLVMDGAPLIGERVYTDDSSTIVCELCRDVQRDTPAASRIVHGPEFGHTMRITDHRTAA